MESRKTANKIHRSYYTDVVATIAREGLPLSFPLSVTNLCKHVGIRTVQVKLDEKGNSRGRALLLREPEGTYTIELYRDKDPDRPFNVMERFSIAHEVGHVLLHKKYGNDLNDVLALHAREDWCNSFAGFVLLPDAVIPAPHEISAVDLLYVLDDLAQKGRCSRQVAAYRLVERGFHACLLSGRVKQNVRHEDVLLIGWSASDLAVLSVNVHSHIGVTHPLGRLIVKMERQAETWKKGELVEGLQIAARCRQLGNGEPRIYDVAIVPSFSSTLTLEEVTRRQHIPT